MSDECPELTMDKLREARKKMLAYELKNNPRTRLGRILQKHVRSAIVRKKIMTEYFDWWKGDLNVTTRDG